MWPEICGLGSVVWGTEIQCPKSSSRYSPARKYGRYSVVKENKAQKRRNIKLKPSPIFVF